MKMKAIIKTAILLLIASCAGCPPPSTMYHASVDFGKKDRTTVFLIEELLKVQIEVEAYSSFSYDVDVLLKFDNDSPEILRIDTQQLYARSSTFDLTLEHLSGNCVESVYSIKHPVIEIYPQSDCTIILEYGAGWKQHSSKEIPADDRLTVFLGGISLGDEQLEKKEIVFQPDL